MHKENDQTTSVKHIHFIFCLFNSHLYWGNQPSGAVIERSTHNQNGNRKKKEEKQLCAIIFIIGVYKRERKRDAVIFVHLSILRCSPSCQKRASFLMTPFTPQTQRSQLENEKTSELAQNCLAQLSAAFLQWRTVSQCWLVHTAQRTGDLHGLPLLTVGQYSLSGWGTPIMAIKHQKCDNGGKINGECSIKYLPTF